MNQLDQITFALEQAVLLERIRGAGGVVRVRDSELLPTSGYKLDVARDCLDVLQGLALYLIGSLPAPILLMTCQTYIHRLDVTLWGLWLATGCRLGQTLCQGCPLHADIDTTLNFQRR